MRNINRSVLAVLTTAALLATPAAHAWGEREQGALAGAVVGALIAAQAARAPAVVAAPLPPAVVATPLPPAALIVPPAAPVYGPQPMPPAYYGHYPVAVPAPYGVSPYPVAPAPVVVGYGWRPLSPRWAHHHGWHHHHRGW